MVTIELSEFRKIVNIIDAGHVIALPTDTIYGLVCKYDHEVAINKIYKIKNRSPNKPLAILVANWEQAKKFGIFDEHLIKNLENNFAKEQVTVIVKKQCFLNQINYWKKWDSIAIRITKCPVLQDIISNVGPLVATSCNISGQDPINDSCHINLPFLEYVVSGKIANPKVSIIYDSIKGEIVRN